MCGIIGYIGNKSAANVVVNGLRRMEYRGYDSAGVALIDGDLFVAKKKGKISELDGILEYSELENYHIGIGHTRWATHGAPSDENSHPHVDCSGQIAVVHNGIIENYATLRGKLEEKGHVFKSSTDTEVIVHLIEHYFENGKIELLDAVLKSLEKLEGTYGIAVVSLLEPDHIIAARKGSPLILGIGEDEYIIASDVSAIVEHTRKVIYINDDEVLDIHQNTFKTYDLNRNSLDKDVQAVDWDIEQIEKSGFDHFMLKEIFEQPETIHNAFRGRLQIEDGQIRMDGFQLSIDNWKNVERIIFIACGTSWHAALIAEYLIEEYARIPVEVEYASEFRYRSPILKSTDVVVVISQSGETADTLAALREAQAKGVKVLGITNVVGSTIARETNGGSYLHAGPEVGVASTKAFTSQVTVIILVTLFLARMNLMSSNQAKMIMEELDYLPENVKKILSHDDEIKEISKIYKDSKNFLYLGRGIQYPIALEGALKLKEISYIHAEGYPAAEMKHGPIALIDENMPVVCIAIKDEVYNKVVSNIQEVKARNGKVIVIATEGDEDIKKYADHVIYVPKAHNMLMPLLTVVPLQLLSYHIAVEKGCDVDQPRNLAKSVTVE